MAFGEKERFMSEVNQRDPSEINPATGASDETVLHNLTVFETLSMMGQGYTLAELKGVKPEQMEALYAIALNNYKAENYEDALPLFQMLSIYAATESKYLMGLAACEQELGKYEMAAETFANAAIMSGLKDPQPMYFAALNLLKQQRKDDAITTLEVVDIMGRPDHPEDEVYKTKALNLLKLLKGEN